MWAFEENYKSNNYVWNSVPTYAGFLRKRFKVSFPIRKISKIFGNCMKYSRSVERKNDLAVNKAWPAGWLEGPKFLRLQCWCVTDEIHCVLQFASNWVCNVLCWMLTCRSILISPVLQNVHPYAVALASYTGVDKITKTLLVLHAETFEMTKPSIMQVIILMLIDLLWMWIVNIVYFSVKSFYPHFQVIWNMLMCNFILHDNCTTFVYQHFPTMQCKFWPLLSQSLVVHQIVKWENCTHKMVDPVNKLTTSVGPQFNSQQKKF